VQESLAHSRFVEYAGLGHDVFPTAGERVADEVAQFARETEAVPGE